MRTALYIVVAALLVTACGGEEPAEQPSAASTSVTAGEFGGVYEVTGETTGTSTWSVTPCGAGCADIAVRPETAGDPGDTPAVPFRGRAHLEGGEWSMAVLRSDGYVCEDGSEVAVDAIYSWNATTLKGSWDATLHEPGCGEPAGSGTGPPEPFTMVKVGVD